jgi:hypothetical protein
MISTSGFASAFSPQGGQAYFALEVALALPVLPSATCWAFALRRAFVTWPTERLYIPDRGSTNPRSGILIGGTLSVGRMAAQWKEILRLATSIKRAL